MPCDIPIGSPKFAAPMQVHSHLDQLPIFRNAILTIGTFDGVHSGHQQILHQVKSEAGLVNGESVIITFDPHPRKVIGNSKAPILLLNTLDEKIALLEKEGIDHLVVVPFTLAFANQPAREYVEKFLVEKFHPHTIIIGYDHQFGHNREGDYHLLEALKDQYNFRVKEIPEHVLHNLIISSTKIRTAILEGNIEEANEFLGYPYFFEGVVVEGNKIGRTIGFPTANLEIQDTEKIVPGDGVYAVEVEMMEPSTPENQISFPEISKLIDRSSPSLLKGMMNIGFRPTVGGVKRVVEVNIFDFDKEIYNQTLRVHIHHRLRREVKFDGLDSLKTQLAKDRTESKALLDR